MNIMRLTVTIYTGIFFVKKGYVSSVKKNFTEIFKNKHTHGTGERAVMRSLGLKQEAIAY